MIPCPNTDYYTSVVSRQCFFVLGKLFVLLLFLIMLFYGINGFGQELKVKHTKEEIDYTTYFSDRVYKQNKQHFQRNLPPMLDVGVSVPNSGIQRMWVNGSWQNSPQSSYCRIFEESPYKETPPVVYLRYDWYIFEKERGKYRFDEVLEPILNKAIKDHSRLSIGFSCNCGSSSVSQKINGKACAVPPYVFEELQKSNYPMFEDNLYGDAYIPNYDSPLLLKYYENLLEAFSTWLEGNVTGTTICRKDVISSIEMRYLGYWGEGGIRVKQYPRTRIIDSYIDAYLKYFPDILLVAPGQMLAHLPSCELYNNHSIGLSSTILMHHAGRLLKSHNNVSQIGLFIDGWSHYSNIYDIISDKIIYDEDSVVLLSDYLDNYVWGKAYVTGEFSYINELSPSGMTPYSCLYHNFTNRHLSGLSMANFTILENWKHQEIPDSIYENARNCVSMLGYRIVLSDVKFKKSKSNKSISFILTNIGTSRMFHNYYRIHLIVKNKEGRIIKDKLSTFDLRTLFPSKSEPLYFNPKEGARITEILGNIKGYVYLLIEDKEGIEYPMTLSNYGRCEDGSYFLGKI